MASQTYVLVEKAGFEEELHINTWNSIIPDGNGLRDGYRLLSHKSETPLEVIELRSIKSEKAINDKTAELLAEIAKIKSEKEELQEKLNNKSVVVSPEGNVVEKVKVKAKK